MLSRKSRQQKIWRKTSALVVMISLVTMTPLIALADQTTDAAGNPTGAPPCTGNGCGQGLDQGFGNGGPTAADLGAYQDDNGDWIWPDYVVNTTQGASNGYATSDDGINAQNSGTGAGSENTDTVDTDNSITNSIDNEVVNTTDVDALANTGGNEQNKNTNVDGVTTGDANIGVTQIITDNTAVVGGTAGVIIDGHNGDWIGDYAINFGSTTGTLTGDDGGSIRAINDTTGVGSENVVDIDTYTEEINEVQNDGLIENLLDLSAITGKNEASMNTSDGSINTGDANIAATLVNLLNTTIINGNLWLTVADIFGDLIGNIKLPDFGALAAALGVGNSGDTHIDVSNNETGADSDNEIDIDIKDKETFEVDNDVEIDTIVNAEAITGQNDANKNTGGSMIETGDASVSASNISLANTTVEGGNWGLVVVNALNRWLGFMIGDKGQVIALSQDETIREIEARNSNTGADSDNEVDIDIETNRATSVDNDAVIYNEITASAITGQNEASKNTGASQISTGDAHVQVTAINIANTTVKDGSLFIAVVNVFGNWFGDLLYGDTSLAAVGSSGTGTVGIDVANTNTGADSINDIDIGIDRSHETTITNQADIDVLLNVDIDTGNNTTNKNTMGADINTGDGLLALHTRSVANLTGVALDSFLGLRVDGLNDTTGFDSKNKIRAELNDERIIDVTNEANVSTVFAGGANTGDNEASMNTIGGNIATGSIDARMGINNLINRVMLAWAGQNGLTLAAGDDITIDADLLNLLTGPLSYNSNGVEAIYDLIIDIANQGLIENLIDLLFNTGGNKSNYNTLSMAALPPEPSEPVEIEPVLSPSPSPVGGGDTSDGGDEGGNEGGGGDGGGDEGEGGGEDDLTIMGSVSGGEDGKISGPTAGKPAQKLTRFPVAGGVGQALWSMGEDSRLKWWPLILALSVALLGVAWHYDQRDRRAREVAPHLVNSISGGRRVTF